MRTLKYTENDLWVGSQKLTRMALPLFRTSKKFYIWFRFPSMVADILDTENETVNSHSLRFEGKQKC